MRCEHHGISNHWQLECLFNRLFRLRTKKRSNLHITGPMGIPPVTGGFPSQRASDDMSWLPSWPGGHFKNAYELLNLRALKFSPVNEIQCNVWVRYFVWNFKGTLWNSTQNILPVHWKIWFLYNIEILRALRFKSSYAFLKCPPQLMVIRMYDITWCLIEVWTKWLSVSRWHFEMHFL